MAKVPYPSFVVRTEQGTITALETRFLARSGADASVQVGGGVCHRRRHPLAMMIPGPERVACSKCSNISPDFVCVGPVVAVTAAQRKRARSFWRPRPCSYRCRMFQPAYCIIPAGPYLWPVLFPEILLAAGRPGLSIPALHRQLRERPGVWFAACQKDVQERDRV